MKIIRRKIIFMLAGLWINLCSSLCVPSMSMEVEQVENTTGLDYFSPTILQALIASQVSQDNVVTNFAPLFTCCKTLYTEWNNVDTWPAIHPENLGGRIRKNVGKDALLHRCLITLDNHLHSLKGITLTFCDPKQENLFERLDEQVPLDHSCIIYKFATFLIMPSKFNHLLFSMIKIRCIESKLKENYPQDMEWSYEFLEKMWFGEMALLSHYYYSSNDFMNQKLSLYTNCLTKVPYVEEQTEVPKDILYNKLTSLPLIEPFMKNPIISLFYGICSERNCAIITDLSQDWNSNCRQILTSLMENYSTLYSNPEDQIKKNSVQNILENALEELRKSAEKDKYKAYDSYKKLISGVTAKLRSYLGVKCLDPKYSPSHLYKESERRDRFFIFESIESKYRYEFFEMQKSLLYAKQKKLMETAINSDIPHALAICNRICEFSRNKEIRAGY